MPPAAGGLRPPDPPYGLRCALFLPRMLTVWGGVFFFRQGLKKKTPPSQEGSGRGLPPPGRRRPLLPQMSFKSMVLGAGLAGLAGSLVPVGALGWPGADRLEPL